MKKRLTLVTAGLVTSASLILCASSAMAHDQVNWSITVGSPDYSPPAVYRQPQAIYIQPRVAYTKRVALAQYREPYYGHSQRESYGRHEAHRREPYAYRHRSD
jgi:hypothetical protein